MHMGAVVDGEIEVRANRFFRKDDARFFFEQRDDLRAGRQRRESRSDLRGVQDFVIEMMLARASQAAADHFALRRADHQAACDLEQIRPVRFSSCRHNSYARRSNGTYAGCSKYASLITRERP